MIPGLDKYLPLGLVEIVKSYKGQDEVHITVPRSCIDNRPPEIVIRIILLVLAGGIMCTLSLK